MSILLGLKKENFRHLNRNSLKKNCNLQPKSQAENYFKL